MSRSICRQTDETTELGKLQNLLYEGDTQLLRRRVNGKVRQSTWLPVSRAFISTVFLL